MKEILLPSHFLAYKGIFYALMAAIFNACDAIAMKSIISLDPAQITLYRFIGLFAMSIPATVKCRKNVFGPKSEYINIIVRGVFGALAQFLTYTAFHYLPLGEAYVIIYSVPISVTIAACIFLKEPCGILQCVLVIVTIIGIMFVVKLPQHLMGDTVVYTNENIYGFLSAAGSFLCRTVQAVSVRKWKKVHYAILMFNYSWMAIIESLILTAIFTDFKLLKCGTEWIGIMLMVMVSYCGVNFMTLAMKYECAGPITTTNCAASIVISFLLQTFLYNESTDFFTIVGAVLVGLCIIGVGLNKYTSYLAEKYPQRKILRYL